MTVRVAALALALLLVGCPSARVPEVPSAVTEGTRLRALREAEVWQPVDTASLDVVAGPPGSLAPNAPVDCRFVVPHSPPRGRTPSFLCRLESGELKTVEYGPGSLEVHAEVFASRLLWLLGFHTDRVDPVRVRCRGCPDEPWDFLQTLDPSDPRPPPPHDAVPEFAPATIETDFGRRIGPPGNPGVAWPALLRERSSDPARARVQRIHREALTLLAAFLGHADSSPDHQTLACHPDDGEPTRCRRPVVYIGDLGSTLGMGGAWLTNRVELQSWAEPPVWSEADACVAHFRTHRLGTLHDTPISEPARAFLAERLSAVSDAQVRALFELAGLDGVGGEIEGADGTARAPRIDDWVRVFDARRRAIVERRCPAD